MPLLRNYYRREDIPAPVARTHACRVHNRVNAICLTAFEGDFRYRAAKSPKRLISTRRRLFEDLIRRHLNGQFAHFEARYFPQSFITTVESPRMRIHKPDM